jgi:hypothetical protein
MPQRLKVVVLAMLDMATMVHYTEADLDEGWSSANEH